MSQRDEDRAIAKAARGAMARSPLDISELNVICTGGYIDLQGKVRAPRGQAGSVNVKREFEQIKIVVRSVHGVKDCRAERVQLIEAS
ncbi:hypothetical protein EON80_04540 [bacterium]|nr:MAG: hypothetical protein EON80_04540 [bacterium]